MHTNRAGLGRSEDVSLSPVSIVVLGKGPFWTQQTCGLIEAEFDSACFRLDSVESAITLAPGLAGLRLFVVDEQFALDLLDRPDVYFGLFPGASVAVAYRNVDIAREVDRRYDGGHGPLGYLPMRAPFDVWLSSIRLLLHGEHFLPSDLRDLRDTDLGFAVEGPAREAQGSGTVRLGELTDREREVLSLASAGNSNKAISRKLAISEHTVKLHMHHVYAKLGVSNRTAAASLLFGAERPS